MIPIADVLIYGAPELSADLFHAVPPAIGDPFLYLENDGRRVATVIACSTRDKVTAHGVEVLDPCDARPRRAARRRAGRLAIEAELCAARVPRAGHHRGARAARVPAVRRRPPARGAASS